MGDENFLVTVRKSNAAKVSAGWVPRTCISTSGWRSLSVNKGGIVWFEKRAQLCKGPWPFQGNKTMKASNNWSFMDEQVFMLYENKTTAESAQKFWLGVWAWPLSQFEIMNILYWWCECALQVSKHSKVLYFRISSYKYNVNIFTENDMSTVKCIQNNALIFVWFSHNPSLYLRSTVFVHMDLEAHVWESALQRFHVHVSEGHLHSNIVDDVGHTQLGLVHGVVILGVGLSKRNFCFGVCNKQRSRNESICNAQ